MSSVTPNFGFILPGVADPVDQDLWGGYLNENFENLDTILQGIQPEGTVPIGAGMDFWGTVAPTGWFFCYGQTLNRTTYADLFAIIGTTYGAGDGSTTFALPDKRGRASFGKDDMGGTSADRLTDNTAQGINGDVLGDTGGEQSHTQTIAEMPSHYHVEGEPAEDHQGTWQNGGTSGPAQSIRSTFNAAPSSTYINTKTEGGGAAFNTLPPGIVCNYIIYAGV